MLFRSANVWIHLVRGVFGVGFLWAALTYAPVIGWWALVPAAGALLCLGGCPMCWAIGLVMTVVDRKARGCVDGSCGTE